MRRLRTVELFCGIGGFRIAADRAGLATVWANDTSAKACTVYADRFGSRELHAGDLRELTDAVPAHDILTAGFPCQPFSSAGKKRGLRDARGHLIRTIAEVLDAHRPRAFVLENVKRLLSMEKGEHFATVLAELTRLPYRVEWRLLNAMDFGLSQNRPRVVLAGLRLDCAAPVGLLLPEGDLDGPRPGRQQHAPVSDHGQRFPEWGVAEAGAFAGAAPARFSDAVPAPKLADVLERRVDDRFDFTESTEQRIRDSASVNRFFGGVRILYNQRGGARMGYTVFGTDGVAPTLTCTASRHYERYRVGRRYRRLTPTEYARLQGFPDDHCRAASPHARYSLLGNAAPPPLVAWPLVRVVRALVGDHSARSATASSVSTP